MLDALPEKASWTVVLVMSVATGVIPGRRNSWSHPSSSRKIEGDDGAIACGHDIRPT